MKVVLPTDNSNNNKNNNLLSHRYSPPRYSISAPSCRSRTTSALLFSFLLPTTKVRGNNSWPQANLQQQRR